MIVLSIQVGKPRAMLASGADGEDARWTSGIFKQTVEGPVRLGRMNLEGDGQADLEHHGGEDRAVLLFSAQRAREYAERWGLEAPPGAFGENLTVDGGDDATVCLGDVYRGENVELQISQPRLPCFKLGRRLGRPEVVKALLNERAAGWYCRALAEGTLRAGETLELVRRPHPEWSVPRAFDTFVFQRKNRELLAELAGLPCLSKLWRSRLAHLLGDGFEG